MKTNNKNTMCRQLCEHNYWFIYVSNGNLLICLLGEGEGEGGGGGGGGGEGEGEEEEEEE